MLNPISIFLCVVAAAMTAAGIFILLRPARKTDRPVKGPADVIKVRNVDTDTTDKGSSVKGQGTTVPVTAAECELEIADMHPGDIIVGTDTPPEAGEQSTQSHDTPAAEPAGMKDERSDKTTDDVSESFSEEHEENPDESPDRPLELYENLTY